MQCRREKRDDIVQESKMKQKRKIQSNKQANKTEQTNKSNNNEKTKQRSKRRRRKTGRKKERKKEIIFLILTSRQPHACVCACVRARACACVCVCAFRQSLCKTSLGESKGSNPRQHWLKISCRRDVTSKWRRRCACECGIMGKWLTSAVPQ